METDLVKQVQTPLGTHLFWFKSRGFWFFGFSFKFKLIGSKLKLNLSKPLKSK